MKIFFSGLKWYYTFEKKYKYSVYQFFGYENGFWYKGTRTRKLIWKIPLKGYCMILKKHVKFYFFQIFDENLSSAWFHERPQGLRWQSALKGYYTILWHKYKNRFFSFFLWKWFFGII